jgi:hypothetical protein
MACPFFMPVEKFEEGAWPHPARLPLGCGWRGHCTASGHEGEVPSDQELREYCNLGYAEACSRVPQERLWDAVRFAVVAPSVERNVNENGDSASRVRVRYVCERAHLPVTHGIIEFDVLESRWTCVHPDHRVQRMAECFMQEYLLKFRRPEAASLAS